MKMREKIAKAIYDKATSFDGDPIAVHLGNSMMIDGSATNADDLKRIVMEVCKDAADAVLSTIAETHVVVPRRSTPRMDTEGVLHLRAHPCDASGCYEAMIASSQQGGE